MLDRLKILFFSVKNIQRNTLYKSFLLLLMQDKILLKSAIKFFSGYSKKFCEVFDALIDISIDNKVKININCLCESSGMKKSTIYFAIQRFQKDGLIEKDNYRSGEILFKQDKLDYYISLLKNLKQHIEKK